MFSFVLHNLQFFFHILLSFPLSPLLVPFFVAPQPTPPPLMTTKTETTTTIQLQQQQKQQPSANYRAEKAMSEKLNFPKHTGIREASLLLVKEKCGRYTLIREPLYLDRCVVCSEADWDDYFEVQEISSKDTFIFKVSTSQSIGIASSQWSFVFHSNWPGQFSPWSTGPYSVVLIPLSWLLN